MKHFIPPGLRGHKKDLLHRLTFTMSVWTLSRANSITVLNCGPTGVQWPPKSCPALIMLTVWCAGCQCVILCLVFKINYRCLLKNKHLVYWLLCSNVEIPAYWQKHIRSTYALRDTTHTHTFHFWIKLSVLFSVIKWAQSAYFEIITPNLSVFLPVNLSNILENCTKFQWNNPY